MDKSISFTELKSNLNNKLICDALNARYGYEDISHSLSELSKISVSLDKFFRGSHDKRTFTETCSRDRQRKWTDRVVHPTEWSGVPPKKSINTDINSRNIMFYSCYCRHTPLYHYRDVHPIYIAYNVQYKNVL